MASSTTYPPPDAAQRFDPGSSEATRYLCAAGHLNEGFARAVVDEVLHQPHRAVAPSHEIRLAPIVKHCLGARRRALARDGVVSAVLLLAVVVTLVQSTVAGLGALLSLATLGFLVRGVQLLSASRTSRGLVALVVAFALSGPATALVLLPAATSLSPWTSGLPPFGQTYDEDGYAVAPTSGSSYIWVAALLAVWIAYVVHRLAVHQTIAVELAPGAYDPRRAPSVDRDQQERLDYVEQAENGNLSVYSQASGSWPFVGYGELAAQWQMASQLVPAGTGTLPVADGRIKRDGPDGTPAPFTVAELYEWVRTGIVELADPRLHPDDAVPHLTVRDRVFVAGRLPPTSAYLRDGRPVPRLSGPEVALFERAPRGRSRHYQCVRLAAWDGEVEVTTFLHLSVRGGMLFVEFVATYLPGILAAYHEIDTYERFDAGAVARAVGRGLLDLVRAPLAPAALVREARAWLARVRQSAAEQQQIDRRLTYDYGCRRSVREMGTDFVHPPTFQVLDVEERVKLVENRLLHVLVTFFRDRGYDVQELVGQASTVINNTTTSNSNTFNNSTLNSSPVSAGNSTRTTAGPGPGKAGR